LHGARAEGVGDGAQRLAFQLSLAPGPDDIVGRERLLVVEPNAPTQMEPPRARRDELPALGKPRAKRVVRAQDDQRLVDVGVERIGERRGLGVRALGRPVVRRRGDADLGVGIEQGALLSLRGDAGKGDHEHRRESAPPHGLSPSRSRVGGAGPVLSSGGCVRGFPGAPGISTLNRSDRHKRPAPKRSPMKVAFVGKGGVGKSLIAATVARLLGRRGRRVLALDIDTMPGLVVSLGGIAGAGTLPEELAERRDGQGWVMKTDVTPAELVERYGAIGPDGIRVLVLGKLPTGVKPDVTAAFRHVVTGFRDDGWSIVGDLAAGTRQASFGWAAFATTVVLVVEPTAAAVLTARRLTGLRSAMPGV